MSRSSLCRTCLGPTSDKTENIYSMKFINNEFISIRQMIALCTGLEISIHDNFTNSICLTCTDAVVSAFKYRSTCWTTQATLLDQTFVEECPDAELMYNYDTDLLISEDEDKTPWLLSENVINESDNSEDPLEDMSQTINSGIQKDYEIEIPLHDVIEDELFTKTINDISIQDFNEDETTPTNVKSVISIQKYVPDEKPTNPITDKNSTKLSDHVTIIKDNKCYKGKRYTCRLCNHMYMRRDLMIGHLRTVHGIIITIPNGQTCPYCYKIFETLSVYKKHLTIHDNPTVFVCSVCGQTLKHKGTFETHMRQHTGEKPYKCKFCDYRSSHQVTIIAHQRKHTGEKPFICHICGEGFISASKRSAHLPRHHEPKFECMVCKKKFRVRDQYKKHIAIHDLSQHIPCKECGKTFAKRSNLMTHMKTHTGEKSHICHECGKGFIQRHSWRTHMKNYHNQIVQ